MCIRDSGHTGRSPKYRHLIDTELNLPDDQISMLAVLMLRGPQTPGAVSYTHLTLPTIYSV